MTLAIADVQGRRRRILVHRELGSGLHGFFWDGRDGRGGRLPRAVCFVDLDVGGLTTTHKWLVVD